MNAVLDAETTVPQAMLSPEAEHDVQAAANLILSGADPLLVLRTFYMLARMGGMIEMASIDVRHAKAKVAEHQRRAP